MVCRFMDSFDYYATADIDRKYSTGSAFGTIQSGVVRTGPNAMQLASSSNQALRNIEDNQATLIIGFAFRTNSNAARIIVSFTDVATSQCSLRLNADGSLEILRSTTTSVAGGVSSIGLISINTWYYIEMKVTIANSISANTAKVQVNGIEEINVTTGEDLQVTGNATANQIGLFTALAVSTYLDDFYIFDGTGSDNNDFVGDVQVTAQFPNTNGATSDFLGSDADSTDNYLHVDEADTDDDSTYVESSTSGHFDLYAFDQLTIAPDTIHAVQINNVVRKDEAGNRKMRSITRPLTTNFFGVPTAPSVGSYSNEETIYDLNPESGGVAWTEAGFNDTQFGINVSE